MEGETHIALVSLGCPKNTVDSEMAAGMITLAGYRLVSEPDEADIALVNTCGFIQEAAQESIDRILELGELKKAGKLKKILVMGCLVSRYGDELALELPEVDGFLGVNDLSGLARFLGIPKMVQPVRRILSTPSHYAYVKIAEGCNMRCTFCTIPKIRGAHVSMPIYVLEDECRRLADRGVKEVILISQDTTWYGRDLDDEMDLCELVHVIARIPGIQWIRIMYLHPGHFTTRLIRLFSEEEKVCRYVDIPVQHISDPILRNMRRAGNKKAIYRLIDKLRKHVPGIALRTTLLIGFPGETDAQFEELMTFVRDVEFERLGVFGYSHEEGTAAFRMKPRVPKRIIKERLSELTRLQAQIARKMNYSSLGRSIPAIIDIYDPASGWSVGRSEFDAPEIDQRVLCSRKIAPGTMFNATIIGAADHDVIAA